MALSANSAYCVARCMGPRPFAEDGQKETMIDSYKIITGKCVQCGGRMVRILPRYGDVIPEASLIATRATYSGHQRYTYDSDGNGRYTEAQGTQAYHRVLSVSYLLSRISGSVDLSGQRGDGMARWGAILAAKASATHFDAVVNTLAAQGLTLPVVMWAPGGADGDWSIGNGHHRITAAVLLGLEWLPVVVSVSDDYMRCEDTTDDEDNPIESDGYRNVWESIRDSLPSDDYEPCSGCHMGCDCCHSEGCPNRPVTPQDGTATRARQAEEELEAEARRAAQAAAGDALWKLRREARLEAARQGEEAAGLRQEAERLIAQAAELEAQAERGKRKAEMLGAYYMAAANLTKRY